MSAHVIELCAAARVFVAAELLGEPEAIAAAERALVKAATQRKKPSEPKELTRVVCVHFSREGRVIETANVFAAAPVDLSKAIATMIEASRESQHTGVGFARGERGPNGCPPRRGDPCLCGQKIVCTVGCPSGDHLVEVTRCNVCATFGQQLALRFTAPPASSRSAPKKVSARKGRKRPFFMQTPDGAMHVRVGATNWSHCGIDLSKLKPRTLNHGHSCGACWHGKRRRPTVTRRGR